jgi:hypothetical protein
MKKRKKHHAKGRPIKSPELGIRVALTVRVPRPTIEKLREVASRRFLSQPDVVMEAIDRLHAEL